MALTNQPYLPLYVKDWLTSSKLKTCSSSSHGVMINIMCIMHKEEEYGTLLLKQNFKQDDNICLSFATHLARLLPFDRDEIYPALEELIQENVLKLDGEKLICNRMVEDARISLLRATSGSKGGKNTTKRNKDFAQAKVQANAEYENEDENEYANAVTFVR